MSDGPARDTDRGGDDVMSNTKHHLAGKVKKNYVVSVVGLVTTTVEVEAVDEDEARQLAETWASSRHDKSEHNDLFLFDFDAESVDECDPISGEAK